MTKENQVICAIQNISNLNNVKENLELFVEIVKATENGDINMDTLKMLFKDIYSSDNSILDLFNVLLLEHDTVKTLYLIKGIKIIMSDQSPTEISKFEKEMVLNLLRTAEDRGVKGALVKVLQEANALVQFKSIVI